MKCVSGVYALDDGEILLDGEAASIHSPGAARRAGIETTWWSTKTSRFRQSDAGRELLLWPRDRLPRVAPRGLRFLNGRAMDREAAAVLDRLKVSLPKLDTPVA